MLIRVVLSSSTFLQHHRERECLFIVKTAKTCFKPCLIHNMFSTLPHHMLCILACDCAPFLVYVPDLLTADEAMPRMQEDESTQVPEADVA